MMNLALYRSLDVYGFFNARMNRPSPTFSSGGLRLRHRNENAFRFRIPLILSSFAIFQLEIYIYVPFYVILRMDIGLPGFGRFSRSQYVLYLVSGPCY